MLPYVTAYFYNHVIAGNVIPSVTKAHISASPLTFIREKLNNISPIESLKYTWTMSDSNCALLILVVLLAEQAICL